MHALLFLTYNLDIYTRTTPIKVDNCLTLQISCKIVLSLTLISPEFLREQISSLNF